MLSLEIGNEETQKLKISNPIRPQKGVMLPPRLTAPKNILLIVPPGTMEESYGRLSAAAGELPMLGLAYIAASLRDQGHFVKIIDYEVSKQQLDEVKGDIEKFKPDVVGMTAYITNMRRCAAVAKIAKEIDPRIVVILGGPQVSVFPEEGLQSEYIDLLVISEGEIIIRNVMNALKDEEKLSKVKGIWFRKKDGTIQRNDREILVDSLDLFPMPTWDLFEMQKYFPPVYIRGKRVAHLLTSRGCPFQCTFCETKLTFGRSFRYHSTNRVLAEIEQLLNMGFDSFQFYDDIFTVNKTRVMELCKGIIQKKWKIQWMCFTRTNCVNDELLALMKDAGCYLITFGAESGNNELLKTIKKNLTVEQNRRGIEMTKRHGILASSSFMIGLPGESASMTEETINFAIGSGLDYAVFAITEPYPGTELWIDAKKFGHFDHSGEYQNNLLSENSAVWVPHGRTRPELEKLSRSAMRRFYLRPRRIFQGILNLLIYMPLGRGLRFFWSGMHYFVIGRFKKSKAGTRY